MLGRPCRSKGMAAAQRSHRSTARLQRLRAHLPARHGADQPLPSRRVSSQCSPAAADDGSDETSYPRDMIGYGRRPPNPAWPHGARIAVQFVLNYEEGSERSILHGDATSEFILGEIAGATATEGARMPGIESLYEYGSRVGFWRLYELFTRRRVPVTVFGVTQALERNPEAVAAMNDADWEIASHGLRWIDYVHMPEEEEKQQMYESIARHTALVGKRPAGWYTGRNSSNTSRVSSNAHSFARCSQHQSG